MNCFYNRFIYHHLTLISADLHTRVHRERDTNVYNVVVFPTSEGGQIHLYQVAIWFTPTLHFDLPSSLLTPTFMPVHIFS